MKKRNNNIDLVISFIIIGVILFITFGPNLSTGIIRLFDNKFTILVSSSISNYDDELKAFGDKNHINIDIVHAGDLEMVDILNDNPDEYDAVWISNSMWLYLLDNSKLVTDSKSVAIDPVLMGVTKSKAEELSFVNKEIYNRDLLDAIKTGKLDYVMTSVTKTNTGATAYLSFLNSLAGSPEVLTEDMINNDSLKYDMKAFFKGVSRVSGDEIEVANMFKNGEYDAIISYESTIINLNKELVSLGKEPLYLLYPEDGVALNDMPFGYVDRDQDKKDKFLKIQQFLLDSNSQEKLMNYGYRTWYGGVNSNAPKDVFNKDWGIDTNKYLIAQKYPSKKVMDYAFDLYVEEFRKPAYVVFCLDTSGSMNGKGMDDLTEAMKYILDKDSARKDRIQFSKNDFVKIITFSGDVGESSEFIVGDNTKELIKFVDGLSANGGTNIYSPVIKALKDLNDIDEKTYTRTVILMTDGESNRGSLSDLRSYYNSSTSKIPVYSITFGSADESQLKDIASLTNGLVFDGKSGLRKAFQEVRSYS